MISMVGMDFFFASLKVCPRNFWKIWNLSVFPYPIPSVETKSYPREWFETLVRLDYNPLQICYLIFSFIPTLYSPSLLSFLLGKQKVISQIYKHSKKMADDGSRNHKKRWLSDDWISYLSDWNLCFNRNHFLTWLEKWLEPGQNSERRSFRMFLRPWSLFPIMDFYTILQGA